jgi:hypothetical protein
MRFGLAHFLNGYSFLMISPNLHDIWAMFFFILSRCGTPPPASRRRGCPTTSPAHQWCS